MVKRNTSSTNAAAAKKVKVNPEFTEIQGALKKAEHLPANCRAMLAAMVPASFTTARDDRSEQQLAVIRWMEKALQQQKGEFVKEADDVAGKLSALEADKAQRVAEVQKAEATLAERKNIVVLKKNALAEATIGMGATKKTLAERQEEQRVCDAPFLTMKQEQEGLASAFVEHFKVPLEAGEALHYGELQPFLANLDLEESFMISVPSSCCKTKDQRGSFDDVVLQALEQALLDRATQIKDAVQNRSPESAAREVGVAEAEKQLAIDRAAQESATAELSAAQKEVELGSSALKELEEVVASCDVEIKATSELFEKARSVDEAFEEGPLTCFRTSKDGIAAADLCATAGA